MCGRWSGISTTVPSSSSIAAGAGFRQGVQDRVELGTNGVAESTGEMPHAVPPLLQFEIAAVLLQLVIDGLRPVGVGGVDHGVGEPLQLRRRQDGGVVGEQLLGGLDRFRVEVVAGEVVHGPFHNGHFLRRFTTPSRCSAASWGSAASSFSPTMVVRGPTAAAARTRAAASPGDSCNTRIRKWVMVEEQYSSDRWWASASAINSVIDERLPVADGFEALPYRDLLLS